MVATVRISARVDITDRAEAELAAAGGSTSRAEVRPVGEFFEPTASHVGLDRKQRVEQAVMMIVEPDVAAG